MKKEIIKATIAITAIAFCTITPFYNMIIKGVYKWHIVQPETWQGGIVVIAFIIITFIFCGVIKSKKSFILFCGLAAVYLFINGVLIPFLIVFGYFEVLSYIGASVLSIKKAKLESNIVKRLISGICVWGFFAIICSLLKFGTFNDLRILTGVLFVIAIVMSRRKKYVYLLSSVNQAYRNVSIKKMPILSFTALTYVVLILMAKSNTALDYDSLWYGLRPEYVLIGPHSFYDDLNLSGFVYFYPKLQELLLVPISNLHDYSFIVISNIFILIFLLVAIAQAAKKIWGWGENKSVYLLLILATIPAIAGISSTAKSDILGVFFIFCGWLWFRCYIASHRKSDLVFSLLCILLCTGTKITCLLWGGLLFCCIVLTVIVERRKNKNNIEKDLSKVDISIMLMGVIFTVGVHLRTWLLTGFLLYPFGLQVQILMGFHARLPLLRSPSSSGLDQVGINFHDMDIGQILHRLYMIWFNPESLLHIIMLWISCVLLCLAVIWVIYCHRFSLKTSISSRSPFSLFITISFAVLMIYFMIALPNPDGNYFIVPILLLCMHIIGMLVEQKRVFNLRIPRIVIIVFCLSLIITQFPIMFVSHPSWAWGTKTFLPLVEWDNFESTAKNQSVLSYNGYGHINEYLLLHKIDDIILTSNKEMTIFGRFPVRIEQRMDIIPFWVGLDVSDINEYMQFDQFIKAAHVKGFILDKDDESGFAVNSIRYVEKNGYTDMVEDENATLYVL